MPRVTCAKYSASHVTGVARHGGPTATDPGRPSASPLAPPVPGTGRIVATGFGTIGRTAILENGDVYEFDGVLWQFQGNLLGTTAAQQPTWGQLKAQYRSELGWHRNDHGTPWREQ